jgi:hypothetical protein
MFLGKLKQRVSGLVMDVSSLMGRYTALRRKLEAMEDYHDIKFFDGEHNKPHYKRRRVVVKKLGRPRKTQ